MIINAQGKCVSGCCLSPLETKLQIPLVLTYNIAAKDEYLLNDNFSFLQMIMYDQYLLIFEIQNFKFFQNSFTNLILEPKIMCCI